VDVSDPDPAATPDDQTRPEPSGDGQRKQRPAWVVARKRRQKADKRRRLVRIGAGLAIVAVLVLAHRTWRSATDDGELSGDEFGDRCADQVDGNADRPPLIVDEVEVSRDLSGDSPSDGAERRIARVRLHRLGDVQIEARQDRVELVREGPTRKAVAIPDTSP
jgi:hypothetical protein